MLKASALPSDVLLGHPSSQTIYCRHHRWMGGAQYEFSGAPVTSLGSYRTCHSPHIGNWHPFWKENERHSKTKKTNSSNLYPPTNDYFRETCKSQKINPIYLDPKFTLGIIRIISKACQVCFSHLLGKGWPLGSHLWILILKSLSHWYPGSGVVLNCIDSWSLPSFLLSLIKEYISSQFQYLTFQPNPRDQRCV